MKREPAYHWYVIVIICVALSMCTLVFLTPAEKLTRASCVLWGSGWSVICTADKDE